jgi:hypothetical protein
MRGDRRCFGCRRQMPVTISAPEANREKAVWELAERLHRKMQHLDPTDDDNWTELTDRQREFYRLLRRSDF